MNSTVSASSRWLHRYAAATALATFVLVGVGGVVTSKGVGMAVPDWPTSYGYNMFLLPFSHWAGGVFYEHTHRLVASVVGLLVVGLTRWLGGSPSRFPLALVGTLELAGGVVLVHFAPGLKGAGHFLSGIGGVVLLAAAVWAKHRPAPAPLPMLGWIAFAAVQLQGLLGGLRVVWLKDEIGIFHGTLAQLFFVLVCLIAVMTSRWWSALKVPRSRPVAQLAWPAVLASGLILLQLTIGATMRHQHAGLAIPDFPLAYGKLWPDLGLAAIAGYNQSRVEVLSVNPITSFQVALQMIHRIMAVLIFAATWLCARRLRRSLGRAHPVARLAGVWFTAILIQAFLGAATVWSNKAADVATAHVLFGALSLAFGTFVSIVTLRQTADAWATQGVPRAANTDDSVRMEGHPQPAEG